jgi:DNA-binding NtrC family response regulator
VRILSATNRNLKQEVEKGTFREDLYYRLSAFPIRVPPLRDRREDIALLASRFVTGAADRHHKRMAGIEPAAVELLVRFDWPGNVRQLRNEIERAVALARDGDTIGPNHLSDSLRGTPERPGIARTLPVTRPAATMADFDDTAGSPRPLREARAEFEAKYISDVLRRNRFNVSQTALALGISRPALQEKMKTYHLR